jgi:YggT family protein
MAPIGSFIILLLWLMWFAMLLRWLFSFVDPGGRTAIGAFLVNITEPIYAPIRRFVPTVGILDFTPLVAMLILFILQIIFRSVWPG